MLTASHYHLNLLLCLKNCHPKRGGDKMSKPLRARYSKIEAIVISLLQDGHVTAPPVPIKKLVRKSKIKLVEADLGEISGLLHKSSDGLLIGVNSTQADVRKRFTMAHEFGHYLIHLDINSHYDKSFIPRFRSAESSEATNVEEIEANFFAASILMPRHFLTADNAMLSMDSDIEVEKLARRYQVSRHAMSLRLVNLFGDHKPF